MRLIITALLGMGTLFATAVAQPYPNNGSAKKFYQQDRERGGGGSGSG